MKVIKAGYTYGLYNVDNPQLKGQTIQFIEKEPLAEGIGTAVKTKENGTTLEELLEVAFAKAKFDNGIKATREKSNAVTRIEEALLWLERDKKVNSK